MQRHLGAAVPAQDRDVVHLAHARHRERRSERTVAQLSLSAGSTWTTTSLSGSAPYRVLHGVGRGVALPDRRAGRDPDHDVDEVPPGRLPEPHAAEVDGRLMPAIAWLAA